METNAVTLYPVADAATEPVLLKVFVEHVDGDYHSVYATPEEAGKIAVYEVMKDTTAYVQIRRAED